MAGQVTYHLLAGAGATRAPWAITTIVSCLPVLVLAMGTALAHLLRADAEAMGKADSRTGPPSGRRSVSWPAGNRDGPDRRPHTDQERTAGQDQAGRPQEPGRGYRIARPGPPPARPQAGQARDVARELA
jgi:hypothetical protein